MSSGKAAGSSLANVERAEEEKIPQDPCSDGEGEGGERTAREKLKKTSIAGLSQFSAVKPDEEADDQVPNESAVSDNLESLPDAQAETGLRGRPSKKRSYEDLQTEDPGAGVENGGPPLPKKGLHKRMRSREVSGADGIQGGVDKLEDIASPVQEESDAEAHKSPGGPGVLVSAPAEEEETTVAAAEADIVQDTPQEAAESAPPVAAAAEDHKHTVSDRIIATSTPHEAPSNPQVPSSSGFANISSASPFSNLKSPKSPVQGSESGPSPAKTTSASAFASSGLSAFASSEKSPFDRLGSTAKSGGGFGGGATAISRLGSAASSGGFGGPSPFASKPASGFGSGGGFGSASSFGGGGFGAAKPFGSGTTTSSFAGSSSVAGTFGKPKPFAATTEADEDGSENGDDDEEQGEDDDERDPRFKEQEIETGEEDEETIFSCRAKLYHFEKEWKERGVGVLKINIRYENKALGSESEGGKDEEEQEEEDNDDVEAGGRAAFTTIERKARLIMRTDGVHRLVLNTPVFKDMNVGTHDGKEPSGRTMHLTGLEEGKPRGFQVKVGKEDVLREIYHKIRELQEDL